MNAFKTSLEISRASYRVLRNHRRLMWFPALSVAAMAGLFAVVFPLHVPVSDHGGATVTWGLIAFYVLANAIGVFFSAGLTCESLRALRGQDTSVTAGLGCAAARWRSVASLAMIGATVGAALGALGRRDRGAIRHLAGLGWTLLSYLALPVMIAERRGGYESLIRSSRLLRQTWGETALGELALRVISVQGVLVIAVLAALLSDWLGDRMVFVVALAALVGLFLALEALQTIYRCALYIFAAEGVVPGEFDTPEMHAIWKVK
jgi:Family of unknown function (DUF6159)